MSTSEVVKRELEDLINAEGQKKLLELASKNENTIEFGTAYQHWYSRAYKRGGSISLNSLQAVDKWLSALVMPPPSLALAG